MPPLLIGAGKVFVQAYERLKGFKRRRELAPITLCDRKRIKRLKNDIIRILRRIDLAKCPLKVSLGLFEPRIAHKLSRRGNGRLVKLGAMPDRRFRRCFKTPQFWS